MAQVIPVLHSNRLSEEGEVGCSATAREGSRVPERGIRLVPYNIAERKRPHLAGPIIIVVFSIRLQPVVPLQSLPHPTAELVWAVLPYQPVRVEDRRPQ